MIIVLDSFYLVRIFVGSDSVVIVNTRKKKHVVKLIKINITFVIKER